MKTLLLAVGLTTVLLPTAASAQDTWTGTVSAFGGASTIPLFSADVVDPAIAARLKVGDRKIGNAAVFGGSLALWHPLGGSRASVGVRGEVAFGPAHAAAQTNPATGTLFGQPFSGALPVPPVDGSTTQVTGTVLIGWDLRRVMPYAGAGGGILRAQGKQLGAEDSDIAPSWTGIAGVAINVSQRVSTYGEYRYTAVEPTLVLGTQTVAFTLKPSQVVAGVSVRF